MKSRFFDKKTNCLNLKVCIECGRYNVATKLICRKCGHQLPEKAYQLKMDEIDMLSNYIAMETIDEVLTVRED